MQKSGAIESPETGLKRVFGAIDRFLSGLERLALTLVVIVIFIVMFLVAADALGRYLFNKPLFFTVDLVSHYLLPIIMLLSASYVLRSGKHISVDLFAAMMPVRLYQALIGLALAATIPIIWIMAYRAGLGSIESLEQGKVAIGLIPWPFWIEQAIYACCMGLLTLRLVHLAAANIVAALTGETDIGVSLVHSHNAPAEEAL